MDKRHFSWFIKLLFLLLMMLKVPAAVTRPLRGARHSDLIAGNELAKLFLERDELQHGLRSSDHQRRGEGNSSSSFSDENHDDGQEVAVATSATASRGAGGRSLDYKGRKANDHARGEESKSQVVKLVTSGSKIVFLDDEYDEDDAAVADAANIELQRERQRERKPALESNQPLTNPHSQRQQQRNPSDGIKVVAVSISSSSKRTHAPQRSAAATTQSEHADPFSEMRTRWQSQQRKHNHYTKTQQSDTTTSSAPKSVLSTTTTTKATTTAGTASQRNSSFDVASPAADFINRSHKSELLIEESEPRTMPQSDTVATSASIADTFYTDSEDSASTSIRKVLAAPRTTAAGTVTMPHVTTTPTTDQSNNRSSTRTSKPQSSSLDAEANSSSNKPAAAVEPAVAMGDQLLPFQTVIYHDTKEGHGPQSRSISYSSISQNVEDLHAWRKSGILAEAQRNVSESLKPSVRPHDSEPAKFYSIPAKMYSMPSKFYSEPAKVYSEPAKVYGEPEKFYSQPAKMYGEPSKFYSEPAKVYSQPAKVYGEPAKTYWPQPASTATSTSRSSTTTTPPSLQTSTTFGTPLTRRPAIVSRIAFGEAKTADGPADTGRHSDRQRNHHSQSNAGTQPRRVLFNLDKLPYDLLNAPEQSPKRLLEAAWDARLDADTTTGDFAAGKQQASCWESSSPHQQHSPPLLDPHSNQNARGSPNTVKCAARYPNQSAVSARGPATSTEPSHTEELYTATPEQNYEIEESVSVVTNGRYHGIQGSAGPATTATITTTPRSRIHWRGGSLSSGTHHGSSSSNRNAAEEDTADDHAADKNYAEDEGDNEHNNDNGDNEDDGDIDGDGGYHRSSNNNNKNNYNNGNNNNSSQSDSKDDSKVAYVVEGRNYRKYRVEEKTDDGFIVGEYGVVDHNDGNLRGVRYTADSTINRSLIQKALLTFLKLK